MLDAAESDDALLGLFEPIASAYFNKFAARLDATFSTFVRSLCLWRLMDVCWVLSRGSLRLSS